MFVRSCQRVIRRHFLYTGMGDMSSKTDMPRPETALPGRSESMKVSAKHEANGNTTVPPFPDGTQMVIFGMGCFWGAEKLLWKQKGVYSSQVGYSGGYTANPTYQEVCSGHTGHVEVVRVVFSPDNTSLSELLKIFWENHNPTQGMRQGNDVGTMYRSAIFTYSQEQLEQAQASRDQYQKPVTPPDHCPGGHHSLLITRQAGWLMGGGKREGGAEMRRVNKCFS